MTGTVPVRSVSFYVFRICDEPIANFICGHTQHSFAQKKPKLSQRIIILAMAWVELQMKKTSAHYTVMAIITSPSFSTECYLYL